MKNTKPVYSALAFAGAIPFVASGILLVSGIPAVSPIGSVADGVNSYGLAIVSFLAGIHWSIYLGNQQDPPFNLLVSSNVIFLFVWIMYVVAGTRLSLVAQIVALIALLAIDRSIAQAALVSPHYFRVRIIVTAIAVTSLIVVVLS